MGPVGWSDAAGGRVERCGAPGLVSRPRLFERLAAPARVTVVSAPPGSGKTVLLRSWISEAGLADSTAWMPVGRGGRDPQQFWLSVLSALRQTAPGSVLVQQLTAAPDLNGWAIVERLLTDLAPLQDRVYLVIDDVHELDPADALRQLELLVLRAPPQLRLVLATRHDLPLGLHRLRLEGELAEIREPDLRFTVAEAGELFDAAGVHLPGLGPLVNRTEGWAAGLRLAVLAAAGHPDPELFAEEFSGSERTVAEYLLAEVLDLQSEQVRRLLLRTSILERVNGDLADLLTGDDGGERVLQDLEAANAFVASLDPARTWFRYHQMFADLLRLEMRRAAPGEVAGLHLAASGWLAENGFAVEAVRHAQAARDWGLAARLLADHWPSLYLDGQAATAHELVAGFPVRAAAADAGLAAVAAADQLALGSPEAAEHYLALAERGPTSALIARRGQAQVLLGIARLLHARQCGNLPAVVEETRLLRAMAEDPDAAQLGLGEDLRTLALISLGITEYWTARFEDAGRHLDKGIALARQIGRPFLEFTGLAYQAAVEVSQSFAAAAEHSRQVIGLARRHGWTDEPPAGIAYTVFAVTLACRARHEEAEPWVQHAERILRTEAGPAAVAVRYIRGVLELIRGHDAEAVAALQAAQQLAEHLATPHYIVPSVQALRIYALIGLGETERAAQALAGLGEQDRERGEIRIAAAALWLARDDPHAAAVALGPVLDGSAPLVRPTWRVAAFLLQAMARDALGDPGAAGRALERALDLAEPEGDLWYFFLCPAPGLLERQARQGTAHAALVAEILSRLVGQTSLPPAGPPPPLEPLSDSEIRVLRYLPTNLTAPEIASELYVSRHTVKTHMRHLYAKLGTHRRADTVARARALGLLAPSALRGQAKLAG
jgi:LuxR family transcriptional regulator, maltose regulon positive regulatory protein